MAGQNIEQLRRVVAVCIGKAEEDLYCQLWNDGVEFPED